MDGSYINWEVGMKYKIIEKDLESVAKKGETKFVSDSSGFPKSYQNIFMVLKKVINHFFPTIITLFIGGIVAVYFQIETPKAYILAAFLGWAQAFIDKVREIDKEIKKEINDRVNINNEVEIPPRSDKRLDEMVEPYVSRTNFEINIRQSVIRLGEILVRGKKYFIVLAVSFLVFIMITYIYLYFNF